MTNKERVYAALNHEQPDKTPYCIGFTQKASAAMVARYGNVEWAKLIDNCFHGVAANPGPKQMEISATISQDEFGVQWDKSIDRDIGNVCNLKVTRDTIKDFRFPDPDEPSRFSEHARLIAERPDEFHVTNLGFSLFERAWTLAGMETFLMAMIDDKEFAHALLERILAYNLRIIERACALPIDAMMFGDDWGQQRGLIMGAALWRELIGPRVRMMYALVKSRGKRVFIHSCGKVDELFPDLIESGLDVFNPFQPEVIDVEEAKRRYGDRLSFYGGISTQKTLPYGSTKDVTEEVRRLLDRVGKNGGYIAAPAHDVPRDAKPENIAAMVEALQNQ